MSSDKIPWVRTGLLPDPGPPKWLGDQLGIKLEGLGNIMKQPPTWTDPPFSSNKALKFVLISEFPENDTLRDNYKKDFPKIFKYTDAEILFWVALDDEKDITNNFFCHGHLQTINMELRFFAVRKRYVITIRRISSRYSNVLMLKFCSELHWIWRKTLRTIFFAMVIYKLEIWNFDFSQYVSNVTSYLLIGAT